MVMAFAPELVQASNPKVSQDECSEVDLRAQLPPVRNQDSLGWCYAFAAADLASFKLHTAVSAADIAMNYNYGWLSQYASTVKSVLTTGALPGETGREGGFAGGAFSAVSKRGFCKESDLPSIDFKDSEFKSSIENLENAKKSIDVSTAGPLGIPVEYLRSRQLQKMCNENYSEIKRLFPGADLSDLYNVLDRSIYTNLAAHLAEKSCGQRIHSPEPLQIQGAKRFISGQAALTHVVSEQLDRGNIVAISYNANVLESPAAGQGNLDISNHVSVIVGRRWSKKLRECELLLRNSWGQGCYGYSRAYTCDRGNIYIPADVLMGATGSVDFVK